MTLLERAVVDAAIRWDLDALGAAVNALLAEREAKSDAGQEYTWGEVVEGDEVFIPATKRWWLIIESRRHQDGRMRIIAKGAPKILTPDPATTVTLRRGQSGKAVDVFNSIMISGPEGVWLAGGGDVSPTN